MCLRQTRRLPARRRPGEAPMSIAFTCARCGRQFQPTAGGPCAICGKVLCASHLTRRGTPSPACDECAPERFPVAPGVAQNPKEGERAELARERTTGLL